MPMHFEKMQIRIQHKETKINGTSFSAVVERIVRLRGREMLPWMTVELPGYTVINDATRLESVALTTNWS